MVKHAGDVQVTPSMDDALCQLLARLERGIPRSFAVCPQPGTAHVFTDGACEPTGMRAHGILDTSVAGFRML